MMEDDKRQETIKQIAELAYDLAMDKENIYVYEHEAILEEVNNINFKRWMKEAI